MGEMLGQHNRLSGLTVSEVVADARYGTIANYVFLHHAGLTAFIPPRQRTVEPRGIRGKDRFG